MLGSHLVQGLTEILCKLFDGDGISAVKKNQNQAKKSESVEPANQNPLVRPIQNPIFAPESSYS